MYLKREHQHRLSNGGASLHHVMNPPVMHRRSSSLKPKHLSKNGTIKTEQHPALANHMIRTFSSDDSDDGDDDNDSSDVTLRNTKTQPPSAAASKRHSTSSVSVTKRYSINKTSAAAKRHSAGDEASSFVYTEEFVRVLHVKVIRVLHFKVIRVLNFKVIYALQILIMTNVPIAHKSFTPAIQVRVWLYLMLVLQCHINSLP